MSLAEIRNAEIEYCRDHIVYFTEKYGHIEDRNSAEIVVPFRLWKEQRQTLEDKIGRAHV